MSLDLVGGPFTVLESDPGVFTTLLNRLGIPSLEVEEILSIDCLTSTARDNRPHALILCYRISDSVPQKTKLEPFGIDPDARDIWFANQLDSDACATLTLLNTLLNCSDVHLGERLQNFVAETETLDPVMRGLAISNFDFLRKTHNSLARPCDVKAAMHILAQESAPQKATKRRTRLTATSRRKKTNSSDNVATYHYIGYVASRDHVWEMDGLNNGPIDLGEVTRNSDSDDTATNDWLKIVGPAISTRMSHCLDRQYQGVEGGIEFNLLAIVDSKYCKASDRLQACKRESSSIERRLLDLRVDDWREKVEMDLLNTAHELFEISESQPSSSTDGTTSSPAIFSSTFASENMSRSMLILRKTDPLDLLQQWERCIRSAVIARQEMEKELEKMQGIAVQNEKRCHDYEPFLREYWRALEREGLLQKSLTMTGR